MIIILQGLAVSGHGAPGDEKALWAIAGQECGLRVVRKEASMGQRSRMAAGAIGAFALVALLSVLWATSRPSEGERRGGATYQSNEGKGADRLRELGSLRRQAQVRDSVLSTQPDPAIAAANLEGYTYYWNAYKQRWLIAAGAHVTAYHQGEQCSETVSDSRGWYNICVSLCCQQGPLVEVEATYSGLRDYFQTNQACNRILRHDFYMDGTQQLLPPGP